MPRSGAGKYSTLPGTDAVAGFTIESVPYNLNVHDVETDLNSPRPIVAGGTGATDINEAMVNLKGERSYQEVVDYGAHRFHPGSFYSATDALGSPINGHAFAGICYMLDLPPTPASAPPPNTNITIEARDFNDTSNPPKKYIRQKAAGNWGSWYVETVGSTPLVDPSKVALAGGAGAIMTGLLTLSGAPTAANHAATKQYVDDHSGGGGGDGGGDGIGEAPTDGGYYSRRNSGWAVPPVPPGGLPEAPTDGQLYGRKSSAWSVITTGGSGLPLDGSVPMTGNLRINTSSNSAIILDVTSPNAFRSIIGTRNGLKRWQIDLGDGNTDGGGSGSDFAITRFTDAGSFGGSVLNILRSNGHAFFTGNLNVGDTLTVGGQAKKPGGGPWSDSSDARTKTELGSYAPGLVELKQLHPVRYRFKGNDVPVGLPASASLGQPDHNSPHYQAAVAGTEYVGLIAQSAETVLPEMVTKIASQIDGVLVSDLRVLDTTSLIYCLVNAVKEMAARIEALETTR